LAVTKAALKDASLITDLNKTYVINKNHLQREKYRDKDCEETIFFKLIDGIYINEKRTLAY